MQQFDRQVLIAFSELQSSHKPIKLTGQNTEYNFVEECSSFKTKQFEMKGDDGLHQHVDVCHINSISARGNAFEVPPPDVARGGKKGKKGGRRGQHH